MSVYVVDASVAAKWFLEEEHTQSARCVLNVTNQLHAPDFFLLEMDNLLCKHIRRGGISVADGKDIRSALARYSIEYCPFGQLREVAYTMANQTARSLYDCLYLSLAIRLNGQMVTADRRLYDALADGPLAEHVLWVGNVASNQNPHQTAGKSQT